jgi:Tat protein secretion system quality control protein TatD with DNase activity
MMELTHMRLFVSVSGDTMRSYDECATVQCIPLDLLMIESNAPFHEIRKGDHCF